MAHAELELILRGAGDGHAADLRFRAPESAGDADLALGVPVAFDLAALLAMANDWPAYGQALTAQLFAQPLMREAWATVRGFMQGANTLLRLRLRIDPGADALHALRWELLQDPLSGRFLCRSERVLFSRLLDTADMASLAAPAATALRALVAVANPSDLEEYNLSPVDVAGELARARAALGDLPTTLCAGPPHGQGATMEALLTALRAGYPLLTLVCHGSIVKGQPILWLEKADGSCDRVAGATLVQRIADLDPQQRPLLIILAACQTAGRDQYADVLAALGPQLARAGVGAVIGMQGNAPMAMIAALLPRLLAELRADGQIDAALALARAALPDDQPWWMPALFMRVRDGRLWAAGPPSTVSIPAPSRDTLSGLAHQLRDPRVREELAEFRAVFSTARDQIGLLNRYKELHDTLQELEKPFHVVDAADRGRLSYDPTAWSALYAQLADLHHFARTALAIMAEPRLVDELAWGAEQLRLASENLDQAQERLDLALLELALDRYRRVLNREMPRADTRLVACAGSLHLEEVTRALGYVQATLTVGPSELGARRELATLISTLDSLRVRLDVLVRDHHRWQEVDSELRRVAESLGGDASRLRLAWDELLWLTKPLFGGSGEAWAVALHALSDQIDQALADRAIAKIHWLFISYQSQATRHFSEVDKLLLATCNELRGVGETLDLILRTLDEGGI
jgi:hypothetical protein